MIKASFRKYLPAYFLFLLGVFFLFILIFTLTRLVLLQINNGKLSSEEFNLLIESFLWGFRFDGVVASYILIPPLISLFVNQFFKAPFLLLSKAVIIYLKIITIPLVLICCADIPYFMYFNARLTTSVHLWMENFQEMMKFLFADKTFYPFMLAFVLVLYFLWKLIDFMANKLLIHSLDTYKNRYHYFMLLPILGLFLLAMRGGVQPRPIAIKNAFFVIMVL